MIFSTNVLFDIPVKNNTSKCIIVRFYNSKTSKSLETSKYRIYVTCIHYYKLEIEKKKYGNVFFFFCFFRDAQ